MPLGIELEQRITIRSFIDELERDFDKLISDSFDAIAEEVFQDYHVGWPIDTGRSYAGLDYYVNDLTMVFTNVEDYAYWVERRWYPIDENINLERAVRRVDARF